MGVGGQVKVGVEDAGPDQAESLVLDSFVGGYRFRVRMGWRGNCVCWVSG